MLDTLVYILFKKLLTTGCDQGCHELLETCAMEIKRNETVWGGERLDEMKNSGMSETMRSLTRKSVCALLSLLLLLSAVLPVKAVAETAPIKIIRVGSFEDTFKREGRKKGLWLRITADLIRLYRLAVRICDLRLVRLLRKAQKRRNRHHGRYFLYGGSR